MTLMFCATQNQRSVGKAMIGMLCCIRSFPADVENKEGISLTSFIQKHFLPPEEADSHCLAAMQSFNQFHALWQNMLKQTVANSAIFVVQKMIPRGKVYRIGCFPADNIQKIASRIITSFSNAVNADDATTAGVCAWMCVLAV